MGSGKLPPDFKGRPVGSGNVWYIRIPAGIPLEHDHEPMIVKPKMQWRLQEVRDVINKECLMRKVVGNKQSQAKQQGCTGRAAQALWSSHHHTPRLRCQTWEYRI
jgi:hypothetical protein